MTPFQQHIGKWKNCTACPLHIGRTKVVMSRGKLPCDLLFIGEGPGKSEDLLGYPFVGPAGALLDSIIDQAVRPFSSGDKPLLRIAFTNLVCCIPLKEDGNKAEQPEAVAIRSCSPRLSEFVKIAAPKIIVCVGKLASDWLGSNRYRGRPDINPSIPQVAIVHPSAILHMNVAMRSFAIRKASVTITTAIDGYLINGKAVKEQQRADERLLGSDDDIPF